MSSRTLFRGVILVVFSALCTSFGQLLWKIGGQDLPLILFGFALYGLGALSLIAALRYGQLSVIHPLMCLGYVFALVNGYVFLQERVTGVQLAGVGLIIVGVVALVRGGRDG
ncbi:MAG: EamA family transporter [Firmicutes bacterium]|nr:EamA family transporter [Bacillota bacterium]